MLMNIFKDVKGIDKTRIDDNIGGKREASQTLFLKNCFFTYFLQSMILA